MNETPLQRADRLIGMRVGSYIVEELLGAGGMGSVYRGVQPEIGKRVAIKFLADEFNANNDLVQRFFQEARAVNLIGHENIVDIFDFGKTPEGRNFFVMELLEGPSLERLLADEKALSTLRTIDVSRQISRALAAAHERGIIHRDLKPDNCFLVKRAGRVDFVKLLDFGIAKLTGNNESAGGRTQTGMILGTPGYMAPEQAGGGVIDQRTDVYALGVMMYRMLGGTVPFDGPSLAAIFRRQLIEDATSLRKLRADVPPQLDELILSMLQREPAARPETMLQVEEELAQVVAKGDVKDHSVVWYSAPLTDLSAPPDRTADTAVSPPKKSSTGLVLAAMAGLTALVIGGMAVVRSMRDSHAGDTPAPVVAAPAPPAPTPPPPAPPPVVVAPPTPPPPTPAPLAPGHFKLHVESTPPEAMILEGDKRKELGKTPGDVELAGPTTLWVKLPGYMQERVDARADSKPVVLTLRRAPKPVVSSDGTIVPPAAPGLPKLKPDDQPLPSVPPASKKNNGIQLDD